MRELNFKQMENLNGGANCFLLGAAYVATAVDPLTHVNFIINNYSELQRCWNS